MCVPSLLVMFAVAGCSSPAPSDRRAERPGVLPSPERAADTDDVACRIGTAPPAERCAVDMRSTPAGEVLTLRRPDGGFRRLRIARDGRGVVAADGAQPARVTILSPGMIEVVVADERYRLPATVRALARPAPR